MDDGYRTAGSARGGTTVSGREPRESSLTVCGTGLLNHTEATGSVLGWPRYLLGLLHFKTMEGYVKTGYL